MMKENKALKRAIYAVACRFQGIARNELNRAELQLLNIATKALNIEWSEDKYGQVILPAMKVRSRHDVESNRPG